MRHSFNLLSAFVHIVYKNSNLFHRTDDYELEEEVLISSTAIDEEVRGLFHPPIIFVGVNYNKSIRFAFRNGEPNLMSSQDDVR